MNFKKLILSLATVAVAAGANIAASTITMADEQKIPSLVFRTGAYASGGVPLADGYADYYNMINERDGGVNGVKFVVTECETGYKTDRGVECYDRTKEGATVYSPWSTGISYALQDKLAEDKIPLLSMGYGRTAAADGSVFKYIFALPATYWNQATSIIQVIADENGGLDKLKGMNFAYIYLDHPYGKEPIPTLDILAKKFGFTYDKYPIAPASMTEQKSTWLQIRKSKPDYAIMWGWGAMTPTAIKGAIGIRFDMSKFIGNWWTGNESDIMPSGVKAKGYRAAAFNGVGDDFAIYADMKKYLYDAGKAAGDGSKAGTTLYNRGLINAAYVVEALKLAHKEFGSGVMTGDQVAWGLEHLDLQNDYIASIGLKGLMPETKITCANHEGQNPAILVQEWKGEHYEIISDWIPAMTEITRPLIEAEAAAFAAEKGITPRECN